MLEAEILWEGEKEEMTMESMWHEAGGELKEASMRGRGQLRRMGKGPAITRQEDMNQLPDCLQSILFSQVLFGEN